MNYHLHHQGQDVGVFPLEELRRRREARELTGAELVWCEGMPQWEPLDAVLQRETPGAVPAPPPIIQPRSNRNLVIGIVAGALVLLAVAMIGGMVARRAYWQVRRAMRLARLAAERSHLPGRESARELASKPVQWTTNTVTVTQVLARGKEFRLRQYLEGYENGSKHNPAYDAEARQLIKRWIDFYYSGQTQTDRTSLVEAFEKLAANPAVDDPLLWTMIAANTDEMQEAVRRFDHALKGYEHSGHKAYPQLCAQVQLAGKLVDLHRDHDRVRKLDDSSVQLLKRAFADGSFRPEDQAEIADILVDGYGSGFLKHNGPAILSVVEGAGKNYHWLALVLEGADQINEAWKARGNGYANTVTPEGWKGFRKHLAEARDDLTKAWQLRPDLTEAPYQMMTVALGDGGIEEMRIWFDRTTAAQIDHFGAWKELRWGLRPRWFGDLDSMLALGITAADTQRYDTDVPRKLFDSITDVEEELDLPIGQHIYGREDVWPHLQQMYEGYIAEPSQANIRDGWRSTYSVVAFLAGKYDLARTQLEAVHWQPWHRNLTGWGRDLSLMPLEVAARTGALASEVDTAESRNEKGDIVGALRLYTELNAATNADERTRAFVRDRLATLEMERHFQAGEWVDFLPTGADLTGWAVERGTCTPLPDGALEVQSDRNGHVVFSRARVGADFEVRGTFEVVRSSSRAFQAGLVIGMPHPDTWSWCSFRMKRNADEGDVVSFAHGWSTRQLVQSTPLNNETNSFYFRIHHGLVTASVNDKQIFKDAKPPEYTTLPTSGSHLGLGAYNDTNETVIRYRNVQVRKLPAH